MRKNLPITNRNYRYSSDLTLISITDLKGRITYCNDDFIKVSGYTQAELLGQPHNLLRHPEVPEEAFRDFWATIQKGRLWSAIIKNRRKNGDTYWVRANATPMRDGDKIVGYLSVRTMPTDSEIEATDALFKTMNQEAKSGKLKHSFSNGQVKRVDILGKILGLFSIGTKAKASAMALLAASGPIIASCLGADIKIQALAGIITAAIGTLGLNRILLNPINEIIKTARQLASGDLSNFVVVNQKGFVGSLLLPIAQLALAIRTVMVDVRNDLNRLGESSNTINDSSDHLQQRTMAQAENINQTNAAMQRINTSIEQTSSMTSQGVSIVNQTNNAVSRSQEAVQSVSDTMHEISDSAHSIADFTEVIESVAFQTNILALNAAVEAARAGESGRGFAVVASEVRVLAQRTSAAAREIKLLIEESVERISRGDTRAADARQRMQDVVESVKEVSTMLENINHAAQDQSIVVQQVNTAIHELESITEQNNDLVSDLANEATEMRYETLRATNNLRVFRLSRNDKTHAETDAVQLRRDNKHELTHDHEEYPQIS